MKVSACCNAGWDEDIGFCHECKEHSEGVDLDYTISDYLDAVGSIMTQWPNSRYGLVLFETLKSHCPDLAQNIEGTDADPSDATYAKDEKVIEFFRCIRAWLPQ